MKTQVVCLMMALIMFVLALTSCGTEFAEADKKNPFRDMFEVYAVDGCTSVLVDKGTRVCYLWRGISYQGGLTVMLDEDGRPLTYWEDGYAD